MCCFTWCAIIFLRSLYLYPHIIDFFFFFKLHLQYLEVLRLGVESELQRLAYATATTPELSHICKQCWILNPLGEARDRTHILMDTSQVLNPLATMGIPTHNRFFKQLSIFLPPSPLATTIWPPSVSINLTTPDTSYKWNHTVFVFCDWLILLSIMPSKLIVYIFHILLILSSVDGYLVNFHL